MKQFDDPTEARAHQMHHALTERGVTNQIWWDRSPWGVRIPLLAPEGEGDTTESPSLFVLTEGTQTVASYAHTWVWTGSLGQFPNDLRRILDNTFMEWIERHWLGDQVDSVAEAVAAVVTILKLGAEQASKLEMS